MEQITYIDHRKDVVVILVHQGFGVCAHSIVRQHVVGKVFRDHSCDPFSGMHGTMQNHGRLRVLQSGAVEMNTSDGPALERVASNNNL